MRSPTTLKAGHRFIDPANPENGYELVKPVPRGAFVHSWDFKRIGNSAEPLPGKVVPEWLLHQFKRLAKPE